LPLGRRFLRNPDLLIYWDAEGLVVRDLSGKSRVDATPEILFILDRFGRPRIPRSVVDTLPEYEARSVLEAIRELGKLGLLLPVGEGRRRRSRLRAWKGNLASALYHIASRDMRYVVDPVKARENFRTRIPGHPVLTAFPRLKTLSDVDAAASSLEDARRIGCRLRRGASPPPDRPRIRARARGARGPRGGDR
jgi:hypothetical protein